MPTPQPTAGDISRARQIASRIEHLTRVGFFRRIADFLAGRPSIAEMIEADLTTGIAVTRRLGEIECERRAREEAARGEIALAIAADPDPGEMLVELDLQLLRRGAIVYSTEAHLIVDVDEEGTILRARGLPALLLAGDTVRDLALRHLDEHEAQRADDRATYEAECALEAA